MEYEMNDENIKNLSDEISWAKEQDKKTKKLTQLAFEHNDIVIDGQENCPEDVEKLNEIIENK